MNSIRIQPAGESDIADLADMVGALLTEIMEHSGVNAFQFDQTATAERAKAWIAEEKYWAFIAKASDSDQSIGVITLYRSHALYAEGEFGTIAELYVKPKWRSQEIGEALLNKAVTFAQTQGWQRLEVTTPPLPEFSRTLAFYQTRQFDISGGRKLRRNIG
ncbi:MAG: GNAT family N-acetyltransferase [Chromatiales bacterium]|nr:GNAT family N-acetyltransferase [Chromatiales bacterium]